VLVRTGGAVWSAAVAEFDLALVEVCLEFAPFGVAGRPVFVIGPQLSAPGEMGLVVADEVFLEDRDVASRGSKIEMSEQGRADVDG
jgi:hypothetical protein